MTWPPPIRFLSRKDAQAKTSAELLEVAKKLSVEEFWKTGDLAGATFMFDNPPGGYTSAMHVGWRDNTEKRGVGLAVRKMLEDLGAERYAVITEAWFVSMPMKNTSAAEAWDQFNDGPPPSEHPDRKECVMIVVWGPEDEPLTYMFNIERRPNTRPRLIPATDIKADGLVDMTFGKLHQASH